MVFWIPPEAAAALAASQGYTTTSGTDAAWNDWQSLMKQYQDATNSGGLPRTSFWLVIGLPADDYSERIEMHDEIPMLMPVSGSGVLVGLAKEKTELDKMLMEDEKHVHLTYKVKIQGQKAWRDLIEFLAKHDMLEKEG